MTYTEKMDFLLQIIRSFMETLYLFLLRDAALEIFKRLEMSFGQAVKFKQSLFISVHLLVRKLKHY